MGVLDWFRGRKQRAQQLVPSSGDAAVAMKLIALGNGVPPKRGSREILEAYGTMPWLHTIVKRRAEAVGGVPWLLYRRRKGARISGREYRGLRSADNEERVRSVDALLAAGALEPLFDHPLLSLFDRPNQTMTGRRMLELYAKHQDLMGESFWLVSRDGLGRPFAILPLVPTWILRFPSPGLPRWTINRPGYGGAGGIIDVPAADVIWIKQDDPVDPYGRRGVGTALALGDELETDEYASEMAKSRMYNRNTPEAFLSVLNVGDPQIKAFAAEYDQKHKGIEKTGQVHFLNKEARLLPLSNTLVESQYVELRQMLRDFQMQVFGCPPEIFGVLENANRSTIDAAEVLFHRLGTVPLLERLRTELQAWLVPEFGDDLVLDYVSPVPSDLEFKKSVMVALPGAFKRDEVRALAGVSPLDDGTGQQTYSTPGAAAQVPAPGTSTQQLPASTDEKREGVAGALTQHLH